MPEKKTILYVIAVLLIATLWITTNYEFQAGSIYTLLALGSLAFYFILKETKTKNELILKFTTRGGIWGLVLGAGFILINILGGRIVIGIPEVQSLTNSAQLLTVGLVYPIIEEIAFKFAIFNFIKKRAPFISAAIITSVLFMLFHFLAYGGSLLVNTGLLFGAFLFSFVSFLVVARANSIFPAIVAHIMFNSFLILRYAQAI